MSKILAIDDKADNLIVIKAILKYRLPAAAIVTTQTGAEGLALAVSEAPDVILLDLIMPEMDGYEVCTRLKANRLTQHIPVVLITAMKTDTESRIKALNVGADAFLAKPIDQAELIAQIQVMLRIKSAEDELRREKDVLEDLVRERTQTLRQELEERKRVQAQLNIALEKYRVLFESFPLGISITDQEGRIIEANAESERLLGLTRSEQFNRTYDANVWRIIRPDGSPMPAEEFASVRAMREQRRIENVEMGIVQEHGDITWLSVTAAPIPLENYGVAITYGDVTKRIQMEAELKAALRQKTVLLQEVHHRTKNNMNVICAMLSLQKQRIEDARQRDFLDDLYNRIHCMALVHEQLYAERDLSHIDLAEYTRALAHTVLSGYQSHTGQISLTLDVEPLWVMLETAIPYGQVLNELLTNAMKYAFPEGRAGEISINLHHCDNGDIQLRFRDNGIGLPADMDVRKTSSFGFQIITMLVKMQLRGHMIIRGDNGTEFEIRFQELSYTPRL